MTGITTLLGFVAGLPFFIAIMFIIDRWVDRQQ